MSDTKWYEAMAVAMKQREKCLHAIVRWQLNLAAAEAEITALRAGVAAAEPAPEPQAPAFPVEWKAAEPQLASE